ncbi:MAG: SpoIID/LytB domain-containing protein [Candidatus Daviesbacteria bacterium]|nr:MAG: SpoIID/LytB domain-containing protein [Candidatus Daviesbacteria bacterium]
MRKFILLLLSLFFLFTVPLMIFTIKADEIEDLQKQIDQLNAARQLSIAATKPLEGQLSALERQLAQIQASLDNLAAAIKRKQNDLDLREEKIVQEQVTLEASIKSYYISSFQAAPLLVLLSSAHPSDLFRELSFQLNSAKQNRQTIINITNEILDLLKQKDKLEKDKAGLASLQAQADTNAQFIGGEVKKAKAYQADLTSKIVALTAKQQQILSQRLASLNISRSAASIGACSDDRHIDPGFSPRLAFFTYGVPNRTGLNQYGADGRGRAGQNVEQILNAYYTNFELKKDYRTDININVEGHGAFNIEDYVKRIYEMPASFHPEALKAQAVAARSYALSYTNNGAGSICTTERCQVFKPEPKGGVWEEAVNATRGWVMVQGGSPVKAWYSSTHGGYILSSGEIGWSDTSWTKHGVDTVVGSASGFTDLQAGAYDKGSPWFYCDWGFRKEFSKTAWLEPSEVVDIINTLLLTQADSSTGEHLYQTDKPNPAGTDNWDEEKVKQELRNKGLTPYNNISSVSISADFGSGRTASVNVSGDGGSRSFSGADFKNRFNLRAPANLQIVGPLFNVEQK